MRGYSDPNNNNNNNNNNNTEELNDDGSSDLNANNPSFSNNPNHSLFNEISSQIHRFPRAYLTTHKFDCFELYKFFTNISMTYGYFVIFLLSRHRFHLIQHLLLVLRHSH